MEKFKLHDKYRTKMMYEPLCINDDPAKMFILNLQRRELSESILCTPSLKSRLNPHGHDSKLEVTKSIEGEYNTQDLQFL